jgi:hypothetical protein
MGDKGKKQQKKKKKVQLPMKEETSVLNPSNPVTVTNKSNTSHQK